MDPNGHGPAPDRAEPAGVTEAAGADLPEPHQPGLMRNRAFLLLLAGMAVSLLGDALYALVLPVWVMKATGSAAAMALLSGTATVVRLFTAPLAGTLADRSDRRRVMLAADLVRALVVLLLAATFWRGLARLDLLLGGAILLAVAGGFFSSAYAAAQTALVHPADLTRSLSLWQMMSQTIAFVGPAIGGAVLAAVGYGSALTLDGLTFLLSAACLAVIRLRWAPRPPKQRRPFWQDFQGGVALIFGNRTVVRTLLLSASVNLAGAAFAVLLPVIGLREMGLTPAAYGLFQMVNPAGAMVGMAVLMAITHRIRRRGRFMLACLMAMGLTNLAMAWATGPAPFLLLLFLGGLCFGLSNVLFADIWRRLIPMEQQGRFFGMQASLNQMLMPVGLAAAGLLADRLSPYAVAGGAGALVMLLAVWGLTGPGLRDLTAMVTEL